MLTIATRHYRNLPSICISAWKYFEATWQTIKQLSPIFSNNDIKDTKIGNTTKHKNKTLVRQESPPRETHKIINGEKPGRIGWFCTLQRKENDLCKKTRSYKHKIKGNEAQSTAQRDISNVINVSCILVSIQNTSHCWAIQKRKRFTTFR